MGAQGYSSAAPTETHSDGLDTFAAHLTSEAPYGESKSIRSRVTSKAYGMEHGKWLGMDGTLQQSMSDVGDQAFGDVNNY